MTSNNPFDVCLRSVVVVGAAARAAESAFKMSPAIKSASYLDQTTSGKVRSIKEDVTLMIDHTDAKPMATSPEAITGQKRGPGRPAKGSQPDAKKARLSSLTSTPTPSAINADSPAVRGPGTERLLQLPTKISENKALPSLPRPQSLSLSDSEYQSIAASVVLHASFDRSRLRWVQEGVFDRYWVKPETGKNAAKPPPDNPEVKWQKHQGPCRIRVEPHIFEAEMYLEIRPQTHPKPSKQYAQQPGATGQSHGRPQVGAGQQQGQFQAVRPLPSAQQPQHKGNAALPVQNIRPSPAPLHQTTARAPQTPQPQALPPQQAKPGPDPVIGMLANRASSDPELKTLMKEVATGNATPEQLKVFQSHIDQLQKQINEQKREEGEAAARKARENLQSQREMIQYDGAGDAPPQVQQKPYQAPVAPTAPTVPTFQHQPYQAPKAAARPPIPPQPNRLILQFTTPGATEDRFLFPQHAILESLSKQHLLASFMVVRKGSDAADSNTLDPGKEYWQNVTLMVEVAYGREHLLEYVKRWVKPPDEVRTRMEEVMSRCERAPEGHLALRLATKGSAAAAVETEDSTAHGTPVPVEENKRRSGVKFVKKVADPVKGGKENGNAVEGRNKPGEEVKKEDAEISVTLPGQAAPEKTDEKAADVAASKNEGDKKDDNPTANERGRPRRNTRKSVRISEA